VNAQVEKLKSRYKIRSNAFEKQERTARHYREGGGGLPKKEVLELRGSASSGGEGKKKSGERIEKGTQQNQNAV